MRCLPGLAPFRAQAPARAGLDRRTGVRPLPNAISCLNSSNPCVQARQVAHALTMTADLSRSGAGQSGDAAGGRTGGDGRETALRKQGRGEPAVRITCVALGLSAEFCRAFAVGSFHSFMLPPCGT